MEESPKASADALNENTEQKNCKERSVCAVSLFLEATKNRYVQF